MKVSSTPEFLEPLATCDNALPFIHYQGLISSFPPKCRQKQVVTAEWISSYRRDLKPPAAEERTAPFAAGEGGSPSQVCLHCFEIVLWFISALIRHLPRGCQSVLGRRGRLMTTSKTNRKLLRLGGMQFLPLLLRVIMHS